MPPLRIDLVGADDPDDELLLTPPRRPLHGAQPDVPHPDGLEAAQALNPQWDRLRAHHALRQNQKDEEKAEVPGPSVMETSPSKKAKINNFNMEETIESFGDPLGHAPMQEDAQQPDDDEDPGRTPVDDALVGPDPDEMDGLAASAEAAAREFGGTDVPKLVPEVHPNIMMMLTQLTMQQKEILQKIDGVDKLGDTLSTHQLKMEEKMATFQNKQQKILDSMDKKIAKNTKDNDCPAEPGHEDEGQPANGQRAPGQDREQGNDCSCDTSPCSQSQLPHGRHFEMVYTYDFLGIALGALRAQDGPHPGMGTFRIRGRPDTG